MRVNKKGTREKREAPKKSGIVNPLPEQQAAYQEDLRRVERERMANVGAGQEGSRIPVKTLIPIVVLALVGIAVPVGLSLTDWRALIGKKSAEKTAPLEEVDRIADIAIDEEAVTNLNARDVAEAFLRAETLEERLGFVRNPDNVVLGLPWFPTATKACPIPYLTLNNMGSASASGELSFERYAVGMPDGSHRLLCVTQTPRGLLVDYEAFARYGTSWKRLLAGEPGSEVRLIIRQSYYFQPPFEDDSKWLSYELSNPDWPGNLTGYAPIDSVTAQVLQKMLSKSPRQRLIVQLRAEEESHRSKQFLIEKVLSSGWVRSKADLESKWKMRQQSSR